MKSKSALLGLVFSLFLMACGPSKEMLAAHEQSIQNAAVKAEAQKFFDLLVASKFEEVSILHTSTSLKEFRTEMSFLDSVPADLKEGFYNNFFGGEIKGEDLKKMSDAQFFSQFFSAMMERAKLAGGINFKSIEVLGVVKQGEEYHVITLSTVEANGQSEKVKELQTFIKEDSTYKAIISDDIMAMPQQFQQMAQQAIMQQKMMEMQAAQQAEQKAIEEAEAKAAAEAAAQDGPEKEVQADEKAEKK